MKVRENVTIGRRVMERTQVHGRNYYIQCSKSNNSISRQPELWFMCFAHHLMVIYFGVKFCENMSNSFIVMERTWQTTDGQTLKISDGITIPRHLYGRGIIRIDDSNVTLNFIF